MDSSLIRMFVTELKACKRSEAGAHGVYLRGTGSSCVWRTGRSE